MKVKTQGETEDAQVIIAQSFGARKQGERGIGNMSIASAVWKISQKERIPVILQKEIVDRFRAFRDESSSPITEGIIMGIVERHREGKYLDTYEVLSQAREVMRKYRWTRAILVAHPAHISRCKKVLEKMGMIVIIPKGLEYIPFDIHSTQWWTRGRLKWWLREIPTRILYKARGWI